MTNPTSNFLFLRTRSVDVNNGRFTTKDPLGIVDHLNQYAYVKNDPTNRIDPSGLLTLVDQDLLVEVLTGPVPNGYGLTNSAAQAVVKGLDGSKIPIGFNGKTMLDRVEVVANRAEAIIAVQNASSKELGSTTIVSHGAYDALGATGKPVLGSDYIAPTDSLYTAIGNAGSKNINLCACGANTGTTLEQVAKTSGASVTGGSGLTSANFGFDGTKITSISAKPSGTVNTVAPSFLEIDCRCWQGSWQSDLRHLYVGACTKTWRCDTRQSRFAHRHQPRRHRRCIVRSSHGPARLPRLPKSRNTFQR